MPRKRRQPGAGSQSSGSMPGHFGGLAGPPPVSIHTASASASAERLAKTARARGPRAQVVARPGDSMHRWSARHARGAIGRCRRARSGAGSCAVRAKCTGRALNEPSPRPMKGSA